MQKQTCYAHGKLLLTGEYLVMEGARALALPVRYGQFMRIAEKPAKEKNFLQWTALKPDGLWFRATYTLPDLEIVETTRKEPAEKLVGILKTVRRFQPAFLAGKNSYEVETELEFPTDFGFGSSSTLIGCLARWAGIDPVKLQWEALGGSGYDVACAFAKSPLFYRIVNSEPKIEPVHWLPPFRKNLFFVYLGRKQRSDQSINRFKKEAFFGPEDVEAVSAISDKMVKATTLDGFEVLLQHHENILSRILNLPQVKEKWFPDYSGMVKSLGAWGGDFVLITTRKEEPAFRNEMKTRGFPTVFSWDELVIK